MEHRKNYTPGDPLSLSKTPLPPRHSPLALVFSSPLSPRLWPHCLAFCTFSSSCMGPCPLSKCGLFFSTYACCSLQFYSSHPCACCPWKSYPSGSPLLHSLSQFPPPLESELSSSHEFPPSFLCALSWYLTLGNGFLGAYTLPSWLGSAPFCESASAGCWGPHCLGSRFSCGQQWGQWGTTEEACSFQLDSGLGLLLLWAPSGLMRSGLQTRLRPLLMMSSLTRLSCPTCKMGTADFSYKLLMSLNLRPRELTMPSCS